MKDGRKEGFPQVNFFSRLLPSPPFLLLLLPSHSKKVSWKLTERRADSYLPFQGGSGIYALGVPVWLGWNLYSVSRRASFLRLGSLEAELETRIWLWISLQGRCDKTSQIRGLKRQKCTVSQSGCKKFKSKATASSETCRENPSLSLSGVWWSLQSLSPSHMTFSLCVSVSSRFI